MHVWYLSFIASLDLRGYPHTALVCTVRIVVFTIQGSPVEVQQPVLETNLLF